MVIVALNVAKPTHDNRVQLRHLLEDYLDVLKFGLFTYHLNDKKEHILFRIEGLDFLVELALFYNLQIK